MVPSVLSEEDFTVGAIFIFGVEVFVSPLVCRECCGGFGDGVFGVGVCHVLVGYLVTNFYFVNVADGHFVSPFVCFVRVDVSSIGLMVQCCQVLLGSIIFFGSGTV